MSDEQHNPLSSEERAAFEDLQRRATILNADLNLRVMPKGGGVVWLLDGPGGKQELASLMAVQVALRDLQ